MINDRKIRALVIEELDRAHLRRADLSDILEHDEIRSLRILESTLFNMNEGGGSESVNGLAKEVGIAVLESSMGKKIVVSLLKAVRKITGTPDMLIRKISVPIFDKAIKLVGINLPFSGDDIATFLGYFVGLGAPNLVLDELIEMVDNMSDEQYKKAATYAKSKLADAPSTKDQKVPAEESPQSRPTMQLSRDAANERRIRSLVVQELARIRR